MAENHVVLASQHALATSRTPRRRQGVLERHESISIRLRSANFDKRHRQLLSRKRISRWSTGSGGIAPEVEAVYLETVEVGHGRLSPVHAAARRVGHLRNRAMGLLPIVSHPDAVLLGPVMNLRILPHPLQAVQRVETALTLAAQEMAQVGIGSTWIPKSLARDRIAEGSLIDLSDELRVANW